MKTVNKNTSVNSVVETVKEENKMKTVNKNTSVNSVVETVKEENKMKTVNYEMPQEIAITNLDKMFEKALAEEAKMNKNGAVTDLLTPQRQSFATAEKVNKDYVLTLSHLVRTFIKTKSERLMQVFLIYLLDRDENGLTYYPIRIYNAFSMYRDDEKVDNMDITFGIIDYADNNSGVYFENGDLLHPKYTEINEKLYASGRRELRALAQKCGIEKLEWDDVKAPTARCTNLPHGINVPVRITEDIVTKQIEESDFRQIVDGKLVAQHIEAHEEEQTYYNVTFLRREDERSLTKAVTGSNKTKSTK